MIRIWLMACGVAAFMGVPMAHSDPAPVTAEGPCTVDGVPCPKTKPGSSPLTLPTIGKPKCRIDDIPCIILTTPHIGGGTSGVATLEPKTYDMLTNPDLAIRVLPEAMRVPQFDLKKFQLQQQF